MDHIIVERTEVAAMLATTDRHVRHLVETGRLRAIRIGGKQRFVRQHVIDFLDGSVRAAEARPAA